MASPALQMVYHQRFLLFVKEVRKIWDKSEVLQVARSVNTKTSLQIISARVDLFENDAGFLAVCYDDGDFFSACCVHDEQVLERARDSLRGEDGVHGTSFVCVLLGV